MKKMLELENESVIGFCYRYVFGTILGVLLIGIFGLLIWKLATYLHDTREYQRFEKERAGAKFQGVN